MTKNSFFRQLILLTACSCFFVSELYSQSTAISDVPHTPDASSVLDVYSSSKGMLVPRLTEAQKLAISSPATSLLIYQTDGASGYYFYNGTAWLPFVSGDTGWLLDGNAVSSTKALGTTTNYDLPVITNNTERMMITKDGKVGIGSTAFNGVNPEKLLVDYGTTTSSTIATFKGGIDSYLQINVQNTSDGTDASTDIVATADNGTDSTNYIDMGINSSNYLPSVDNFGGPNDGYLYTNSRHLLLGTQALNSDIAFLVSGGQISVNQAMRIDGATKNIIIGRKDYTNAPVGNTLRGPNGSGTNINGGSLSILGGSATGTGTGGVVNINGGATVSGTGGAVNINVGVNNATYINTGSNNQNVTIGNSSNNIYFPKWTVPGGVYFNANAGGLLNNASMLIWDNTNTRLGIGTTTPTEALSFNGDAAKTIWMERHTTANTSGNSLTLKAGSATVGANDKNGGALNLVSGVSTGTGSSNIAFFTSSPGVSGTADNASTQKMIILGNGNVGMGTALPVANLHLYGTTSSGFTPSFPTLITPVPGPEIAFSRGGFTKPGASIQMMDYDNYSSGLCFNVHKGIVNGGNGSLSDNWPTDVVQAMTIDNMGLVGILTADPNTKLDVNGDFALRMNTFAAVNGNNNNMAIPANSFIKISGPTASFTITGIAGGYNGKIVTMYNSTGYNMTTSNNNALSSAANQIVTLTGANITTTGTGAVTLQYDGVASKWIVIAVVN